MSYLEFDQHNFADIFKHLEFKLINTLKITFSSVIYLSIYRPRRNGQTYVLDITIEQFHLLVKKIHQFKINHLMIVMYDDGANTNFPYTLLQNIRVPIIRILSNINMPFCYANYVVVTMYPSKINSDLLEELLELNLKGNIKKLSFLHQDIARIVNVLPSDANLDFSLGYKRLTFTHKNLEAS